MNENVSSSSGLNNVSTVSFVIRDVTNFTFAFYNVRTLKVFSTFRILHFVKCELCESPYSTTDFICVNSIAQVTVTNKSF